MMKIQHLLWGYSNGHHLLASSILLSPQSAKLLGMLTDLSGPEMVDAFDGYLTGCPLPSDGYYALSKTWFAAEMDRPGCVWTHTLLLDKNAMSDLTAYDLERLYQRPQWGKPDWETPYTIPIQAEPGAQASPPSATECDSVLALFAQLTRHMEPIIVPANSVEYYNYALETLIGLAGWEFFQDITFCTGSFSNRKTGARQLSLQIVPNQLFKSLIRTAKNSYVYTPSALRGSANDESLLTPQMFCATKNFVLACGSKYFRRTYWLLFQRICGNVADGTAVSFKRVESELRTEFDIAERSKILWVLFDTVFLQQEYAARRKPDILTASFLNFLTLDQSNLDAGRNAKMSIRRALTYLLDHCRHELLDLFPEFMTSELNDAGEQSIAFLSAQLTTDDYSRLLKRNTELSIPLLRNNCKLALCADLWRLSRTTQIEALRELQGCGEQISVSDGKQIIRQIFQISPYNLSKEVYRVFGDQAIDTYFECFYAANGSRTLAWRWSALCGMNQSLSVHRLTEIASPHVFQAVIHSLDPYNHVNLSVSYQIWEELYRKFCQTDSSDSVKTEYAQFVLPIILESNAPFSIEFQSFAFYTVHKLLADHHMNCDKWERLSPLLPEVKGYQSWDKCKRLRKAAKRKGIQINFAPQSDTEVQ